MTIMTLLNQIKNGDIVLPAIQRDFVWDEGRIEMLLDSIMRGYPVGIVLLWETYEPIQYRKFEATYSGEKKQKFSDNLRKNRRKVVLDGQQRLQSLFGALYGKYKGRTVYFDVLSGRDRDDSGEIKYVFKFGTTTQANQWNDRSQKQISRPRDKRDDNHQLQHFVATERIFQMTAKAEHRRALGVPLMLRLRLVECLRSMATQVEQLQRESEEADFWANRLITGARRSPERLIELMAELVRRHPEPTAHFASELVAHLYDEDTALPMVSAWLDPFFGTPMIEVVQEEHRRQVVQQTSLSNVITSCRRLTQIQWHELFERSAGRMSSLRKIPRAFIRAWTAIRETATAMRTRSARSGS